MSQLAAHVREVSGWADVRVVGGEIVVSHRTGLTKEAVAAGLALRQIGLTAVLAARPFVARELVALGLTFKRSGAGFLLYGDVPASIADLGEVIWIS